MWPVDKASGSKLSLQFNKHCGNWTLTHSFTLRLCVYMWVCLHAWNGKEEGVQGKWGVGCFWPFPPPFLSLFSASHYLTALLDFSKVHITDLTSPSFKSAFACCCYMCVPNTSLKLDSTQGCHNPSISLLPLSCFVSVCVNLENSLHREVQSWCHYKSVVHTWRRHPLKHPGVRRTQSRVHVRAHTETPGRSTVCLLTVQIQVVKRIYVVWAFLSPTSPTASDNKRKGNS